MERYRDFRPIMACRRSKLRAPVMLGWPCGGGRFMFPARGSYHIPSSYVPESSESYKSISP